MLRAVPARRRRDAQLRLAHAARVMRHKFRARRAPCVRRPLLRASRSRRRRRRRRGKSRRPDCRAHRERIGGDDPRHFRGGADHHADRLAHVLARAPLRASAFSARSDLSLVNSRLPLAMKVRGRPEAELLRDRLEIGHLQLCARRRSPRGSARRRRSCGVEQPRRLGACFLGDRGAREHARDFLAALGFAELADGGPRAARRRGSSRSGNGARRARRPAASGSRPAPAIARRAARAARRSRWRPRRRPRGRPRRRSSSPRFPASASATLSARMKRDSSPPEAIRVSGPNGAPGLVETSNSTRSVPGGPGSASPIAVRKRAESSLSGASSAATAASSRAAASRRCAAERLRRRGIGCRAPRPARGRARQSARLRPRSPRVARASARPARRAHRARPGACGRGRGCRTAAPRPARAAPGRTPEHRRRGAIRSSASLASISARSSDASASASSG